MADDRPTISLSDFLSEADIKKCIEIWATKPEHEHARTIASEVIEPQLVQINQKLGQENNPLYLAYVVCYAIQQAPKSVRERSDA